MHYEVLLSGLSQFEVIGSAEAHKVELERNTFSCRVWQLNGYGCVHYVACISYLNMDVEPFVVNIFSTITFMKCYKYNFSYEWEWQRPQIEYTPPLSPVIRMLHGRPDTNRNRRCYRKSSYTQGL